jgi:1-phosphofructokinase family hexose kinase
MPPIDVGARRKLLCITPNPALDRTLTVPGFAPGGVFRTSIVLLAAGGKGLNVARAARILGAEALCVGILAGHTGRLFAELAEREGLTAAWTWANGETRVATIVVSENGATVLNETGVTIQPETWARFKTDVLAYTREVEVICMSGSFPPGVTPDDTAHFIDLLAKSGKPVWIDSSGTALRAALETNHVNVKVNSEEIGDVLDCVVNDVQSAVEAAAQAHRRTSAAVVVTLGKLGAVMVTAEGRYVAQPPDIPVKSDVGSGDSFLAGLATADATPEGVRRAVAAGTANALSVGGGQFSPQDFEQVLAGTTISIM